MSDKRRGQPLYSQPEKKVQKDIQTPQFTQQRQKSPQKSMDLNSKIRGLPIDEKFRGLIAPNKEEIKKQLLKRAKEEKKKKAVLDLIKQGKIIIQPKKKETNKVLNEDIRLTEDGKLVVRERVIQFDPQASLKINKEEKQKQKIKQIFEKQKSLSEAINNNKLFLDKNLNTNNSFGKRRKKDIMSFNFIDHKYQENDQEDQNMQNINFQSNQNGNSFKRVSVTTKHYDPIPNIEWWDVPILPQYFGSYMPTEETDQKQPATAHTKEQVQERLEALQNIQYTDKQIQLDKITHLIEHPKPLQISEVVANRDKVTLPSFLTKQERKKRIRKLRLDREKEKQDKIRLGLRQPSPPRIRLQNMLRIMCTEAINDPSKAEKEVKKQIQARKDKHDQENEQRKLTQEQKGEKLKQKWQKDAASEIRVAVFRIDNLNDKQLKFKVNTNAKQVFLQGVCLYPNSVIQEALKNSIPSIVVAEGGPKGMKFYKKLLLQRIKWPMGTCTLIWEGIAKQHAFNKWKAIEIKSEAEGKRILAEKGVEQYWDLAINK
ncbi:hypothetical protein pb186bvf_006986 [Paramecium bursaria]